MPNNNIDERVVEMQIDNRQFIQGAEKSISILDKLKAALNFNKTDDSLDKIGSNLNQLDFSRVANSVDNITDRFSNLGIVGMRVVQNLTDSAYNFVASTAKSLSIDQISSGWQKYGDITSSVQTIISATGLSIEDVTEQISKLNAFTDETSYNLTDMVGNIGKFTSSGIALDQAVIDMQGIATWAGLSGANSEQASRAMYNLSQAIGMGSVKVQDWMSIENANMATSEFKQTVIDTAISAGRLKVGLDGVTRTAKGTEVTVENFRSTLSEGWFDSNVLEASLQKYGEFADIIVQISDDTGVTVTDLLDILEDYKKGDADLIAWQEELRKSLGKNTPSIDALSYAMELLSDDTLELGERAFRASQEAKTFQEAIDSVKDAVSTGWMNTFQYIFGDYEEAKRLWTDLANELYDIFALAGERRNAILDIWHDSGGRDILIEGFKNFYHAILSITSPISEAFDEIFSWGDVDTAADKLLKITEKFRDFTEKLALSEEASVGLKNAMTLLFGKVKDGSSIIGKAFSILKNFAGFIKRFVELFLSSFTETGFDKDNFLNGFSDLLSGILDKLGSFGSVLKTVFNGIKNFLSGIHIDFKGIGVFLTGVWDFVIDKLTKVWDFIKQFTSDLKESFSDENLGLGNILKIGAGLGLLVKAFLKFNDIKWTADVLLTPIKTIYDFMGGVYDALELGFDFKAITNAIFKFSVAIGILSLALLLLSSIDSNKIGTALALVSVSIAEMVGSILLLRKFGPTFFKNPAKGLIQLAETMLILSVALLILSKINPDSIGQSLVAFTILLAELLAFIVVLNALKIKGSVVRGIVSLALGMLIFVGVIYLLGSIPYDKLQQGLIALAVALAIVSVAMIALSLAGGKALLASVGMVFLASSLLILVGAIALLSLIKPDKIATALVTLGAALLIIAVAVFVLPPTLPLIAVGLLLVSVAIAALAAVLIILTKFDLNELASRLAIVIIALLALVPVLALMQMVIPGALALLAVAAAFAIVSVGLIALSVALRILSGLPLGEIAGGMALVGAGLLALAVGLAVMTIGIIGAVALIAAGAGLIALAAGLNMLVGLDLPGMSGGLALLGASLIALGIGGIVMLLGVPGLLGGALAIGLMGIALIPFVYALKQLESISFLTVVEYLLLLAGTAGALALLSPILTPLAIAVGAFGVACLAAGEGLNLAGDGMVKIANSILSIPENAGKAFKEIGKTVLASVTTISSNGEEVVKAVNLVGQETISAINQNGSKIVSAVNGIIISSVNTVSSSDIVNAFKTAGGNIPKGIAIGISSGSSVALTAIHNLANAMISQFLTDFDINSPSDVMAYFSSYIPMGAAKGVNKNSAVAVDAVSSMGGEMIDSLRNAMTQVALLSQEDFSISPVITPVVDMSNVDSSAASIYDMFANNRSTVSRISGISRSMDDISDLSASMSALSENRANNSMDTYEINVYPSPGMDEDELADAILYKISSTIGRKGAALG